MFDIVRARRGLKKDTPTLDVAELGFATDTNELIIGNTTGNVEFADKAYINTALDNKVTKQISIPGDADLNDYTIPGMYFIEAAGDNIKNMPVSVGSFALFVERTGAYGHGVVQTYTAHNNGVKYVRVLNETWSGWSTNTIDAPILVAGDFGGSSSGIFSLVGAIYGRKHGRIWIVDYSLQVAQNNMPMGGFDYGIDITKIATALGFIPSISVTGGEFGSLSAFDVSGLYMYEQLGYAGAIGRYPTNSYFFAPGRIYADTGDFGLWSSTVPINDVGVQWTGSFHIREE